MVFQCDNQLVDLLWAERIVWQVRENARNAMKSKSRKFSTLKDALGDINSRLKIGINEYIQKSKILRQRRIADFI